MTVVAAWLTNRGDAAGGQTRAATRLTPIGTWWPTAELTSRSGLIPGGSPCLVTGTGMTASVAVGRAILQGSAAAGAYAVAVTAAEPVTIPNGDAANPRRDLIGIRVYNNPIDASGQTIAKVERLAGTPAPSPVDPTPPVGAVWLPLARVLVPAGASAGSPINWGTAVTDLRVYTIAAGGVLPVDAGNAAGSYVGQVRIVSGRLVQWDGTAWSEFSLPSTISPSTWGAWTQSTPTWQADGAACTIGNGTLYQRWCRIGRLIQVRVRLKFGSTTSSGSTNSQWTWSIPVPAATTPDSAEYAAGSAGAIRSGAAYYGGTVLLNPATSKVSVIEGGSGFNWGTTLNTPFPSTTPGTTDSLWLSYAYEAAS
ncbi:hypothetical protein B4N89_02315 [Embleya scabrispora]|uniref:Uncharacterized protein n=1 Tax=Embleya scabrispora TaxID=159449 RepID=A0A1T3NTC2_9ACTN|nr:hypothetical protein [Embleya scabrispora]OPC79932.1 hypothetical protein B4N89_02315 [Embleya scabrispora]